MPKQFLSSDVCLRCGQPKDDHVPVIPAGKLDHSDDYVFVCPTSLFLSIKGN